MRRVALIRGKMFVVCEDRHDMHQLYFRAGVKPHDVERVYVPQEIKNLPGATILVTSKAQNFPNIEDFYQTAADMDCHLIRM